mmetsp:Transcript_144825/g.449589  ORF Transcript_144825/g.449589 Transcript_144825/m.449589 type:complete len:170 (-) Transcript_144825:201-710(-)|eukprot:CAMPEP_0204589254 /NCGR_PEP_ID=MMETSP0661-20131031/49094_1 /ASSEMBLY_ACC=CAM_ASM_000606 /TAXON_ID=109239 /ORGANISM="Alexandrium margalefi, Strain AMGDE01CS-322" /LENGTH=169 /DNA_ID=CAMNT_0051599161 /DNA_START=81 /DNA_END=590 /DNA_ORIENTATION=+
MARRWGLPLVLLACCIACGPPLLDLTSPVASTGRKGGRGSTGRRIGGTTSAGSRAPRTAQQASRTQEAPSVVVVESVVNSRPSLRDTIVHSAASAAVHGVIHRMMGGGHGQYLEIQLRRTEARLAETERQLAELRGERERGDKDVTDAEDKIAELQRQLSDLKQQQQQA